MFILVWFEPKFTLFIIYYFIDFLYQLIIIPGFLGHRLTVGQEILVLFIAVRIRVAQPIIFKDTKMFLNFLKKPKFKFSFFNFNRNGQTNINQKARDQVTQIGTINNIHNYYSLDKQEKKQRKKLLKKLPYPSL